MMIQLSRTGGIGYFLWLSIAWVGVVGFVFLLVLGNYIPNHAAFCRVAAFGWFVVCGVIRLLNEKRWIRRPQHPHIP